MTSNNSTRPESLSARGRRALAARKRGRPVTGAGSRHGKAPRSARQRHAEEARIEHAVAMLDRLDIARHLLRLEPLSTRTALALQLLEQTADDVADLAGMP